MKLGRFGAPYLGDEILKPVGERWLTAQTGVSLLNIRVRETAFILLPIPPNEEENRSGIVK